MTRLFYAALAAVSAFAAPASAQSFFNITGTLTSFTYDLGPGGTINSPFNAVVSFNGSAVTTRFSSSVLTGVPAGPGVDFGTGFGSVTKVSDLEYRISAIASYGDTPADVYADLLLASPLPATPGYVSLLSTSTIQLQTRFHTYYGTPFSLTTAVPEAASWAMMLVGIGAIGASVRRRRKATVLVRYV